MGDLEHVHTEDVDMWDPSALSSNTAPEQATPAPPMEVGEAALEVPPGTSCRWVPWPWPRDAWRSRADGGKSVDRMDTVITARWFAS